MFVMMVVISNETELLPIFNFSTELLQLYYSPLRIENDEFYH